MLVFCEQRFETAQLENGSTSTTDILFGVKVAAVDVKW